MLDADTIPKVLTPGVTVKLKKDGVSETVTVAIPFGCRFAIAVILFPLKSRVVILPAVPTTDPSSYTLKPFKILLTEKVLVTLDQDHPPAPFATGTYPDRFPKSDPLYDSLGAWSEASVETPDILNCAPKIVD